MSLPFPSHYPASDVPSSSPSPNDDGANQSPPPPPPATPQQQQIIDGILNSHEIIVLLKGPPHKPHCKFSKKISQRLISEGIRYYGFNVFQCRDLDTLPALHLYHHLKFSCDTFPQLWISGSFISNLSALDEFNQETHELAKYILDVTGKDWANLLDEPTKYTTTETQENSQKVAKKLLIRVREPDHGRILDFHSLADAQQWGRTNHMYLWLLKFPGYQDIVEDESNLPTEGIIPICAESKDGTVAVAPVEKRSWMKYLPLATGTAFLAFLLWKNQATKASS